MTDVELLEIEARCAAASTGPWKVTIGDYDGEDWIVAACGPDPEDGKDRNVTTDRVRASELRGDAANDADFIAHARVDVLALVAEVRRQGAALALVEQALTKTGHHELADAIRNYERKGN